MAHFSWKSDSDRIRSSDIFVSSTSPGGKSVGRNGPWLSPSMPIQCTPCLIILSPYFAHCNIQLVSQDISRDRGVDFFWTLCLDIFSIFITYLEKSIFFHIFFGIFFLDKNIKKENLDWKISRTFWEKK